MLSQEAIDSGELESWPHAYYDIVTPELLVATQQDTRGSLGPF